MMLTEKSTLKRLKHLPALFRKVDAEKVAPHTAQFLSRATAEGLIHRIKRGHYINSFLFGFPNVETVACFLRPPAYISCEWALNYHGISLQVPFVCTAITLSGAVGRRRTLLYQGIAIEFSKIADRLFTGFETIDGFQMATPEKAVLDSLHFHGHLAAADELQWDALNRNTLLEQGKAYPTRVLRQLEAMLK